MSMTFTNLVIASIVAYIIYFYVIPNRTNNSNSNNSNNSTYNYLLVYGILLPILFTIPFFLIDLFQVDNLIMALGTGFIPLVYCLRCSETTCGFSPKYVEVSFMRYWLWFICPVSILFEDDNNKDGKDNNNNKKPVKATRQDIRNKLWETVRDFILIGFFLSILIPRDFTFFSILNDQKEQKEKGETILLFLKLFFQPKHLFNNFIMAWLTNMVLSSGMNIISLGINIVSSIKVIDVTQNPMFESSSPSDFWGNRWNKLVHQTLKGGVYKPIRSMTNSATVATLSTFFLSGLLHDYLLVLFTFTRERRRNTNDDIHSLIMNIMYSNNDGLSVAVSFGNQTLFFLWNAILIALESYIVKHNDFLFVFEWMKNNLPKRVISLLVVLCAVPLGHLFTDEYTALGVYKDYSLAVFGIVQL
eukprot:CAMPEP_0178955942 /NCGR_PEP_ID=MMETSP0789-20121207/9912_1 /TAXON_ID=3005 /ORGANISM="Rhizosolenia setigera, Strain CCMP 1694" /LENGTH=415 /DNA_ID=CAMNT_0020637683 /DNA_START=352 /DNA_END=1599 /DNA_ORIENTATION=+